MNNLEPETKCAQLKEEVMRWPHKYICGRAKNIAYTFTCPDEMVKCLLAFGTGALRYAGKILATIEWGMQHWKMEEPFPVLPIPKWLCTPELTQTTTPLRGELSLPSPAIHLRDIYVRGPALWSWMAVLMQYWQDHISVPLYGGRVRKASELAKILMRDINPWLPHHSKFGWDYIADHCTLWLDVQEQRQVEMDAVDSREEEAKKLPPEHQAAHEQWQRKATPAWMDVCPAGMEGSLYLNWQQMQDTK